MESDASNEATAITSPLLLKSKAIDDVRQEELNDAGDAVEGNIQDMDVDENSSDISSATYTVQKDVLNASSDTYTIEKIDDGVTDVEDDDANPIDTTLSYANEKAGWKEYSSNSLI